MLTGTASELERDLPFWVFVDALDEYVREPRPRCSRRSATRCWPSSRRCVPGVPGVVAAPAQAGTHERYRIHRAVALLLERLAAYRPLVLVLDDLHWADSGSFELLASLLRRPPAAPVLSRWPCARGCVPERSRPRSSARCAAAR